MQFKTLRGTVPLVGLLLLLIGISPAGAQTGSWTATFYNNENLNGDPVLTRFDATPSDNWGAGSPAPQVNADSWSARWTRTRFFDGGLYRFTVQADDGVRVFVDGDLIINEWHLATGETYNADVSLSEGQHTVTVEYFENELLARLNYGVRRVDTITPIFPGTTVGTITTDFLNLRNEPSITSPVLALLDDGEVVRVLDRTVNGDWLEVNADGIIGWVDSEFVRLGNETTPDEDITAARATVTTPLLNVRDQPDPLEGDVIAQVQRGETYPALRINSANGWVQIQVNNNTGWVNENYVSLINADTLPEIIFDVRATVTAGRLNVRRQPNLTAGVLLKINRGETYPVLGQDVSGEWLQIDVNGTIGWVSDDYVTLTNPTPLPVVDDTPTDTSPPPQVDNPVVTATPYTVNIRSGPGTEFADIGNMDAGTTARVIGQNPAGNWWKVNYNGIVGWVTAQYTRLQRTADPGAIPVVTS
jgi:uncharacterized protein YgiM (DUF1202 family)